MAINKTKVLANAQKYAEKGAYDKAIAEYLKVVKEDPEDVRAWLKIGDLYAKKGSHKEATATYLKVAEFYAGQGFYLKAVAVYKQILKLDPTVVQVNLRLAELYQQLGLLNDAQNQYAHVGNFFQQNGRMHEALEVLQKLVDLDPENVPSRIKLAELYSKAEQRSQAVREFEVAAEQLREQGRIDDFIKVAERLLWHCPEKVELGRELASLYLERGDPKGALARLQQCFQVAPKDIETLSLLARAFQSVGQLPKTISVYKEMARVFEEKGDAHRRREVLQAVLGLAPGDPEAYQALYGRPPPGAVSAPRPLGAPSAAGQLSSPPPNVPPSHGTPPQELAPSGGFSVSANFPLVEPPVPGLQQQNTDIQLDAEYELEEVAELDESGTEESEEIDEINEIEELDEIVELEGEVESPQERAERYLKETDVFVKYGLYDKAIEHLFAIFDIEPLHVEAHVKLKDLYFQLGDSERALPELLCLADLTATTDPVSALSYVRQVLQLVPGHAQAAALLQKLEGPPPAPAYQSSPPPMPSEASALFFALDEELLAGPDDTSESADEPTAEHETPAPPTYVGEETQLDFTEIEVQEEGAPTRSEAQPLDEELEEVEFFLQQGLVEEARNLLNDLSRSYPGNRLIAEKLREIEEQGIGVSAIDAAFPSAPAPSALARETNPAPPDSAGGSRQKRKKDQVTDVFEQFKICVAQQVDEGDSDTHFDLGIAYKEMGLVDDAVAEFELAGENPDREAIAQTMIGHCYAQAGRNTEAISAYKKGLYAERRTEPEELELYYALGSTYLALSDPKEALYYFQKVAKRVPDFRDIQERIASIENDPQSSSSN